MSVEVTAITVYFQDGNSDKFYRVYYFDKWAFFQNGRRGTTGTFRDMTKFASPGTARAAAMAKLQSKEDEGYQDRERVTFLFDASGWAGSKDDCKRVDALRELNVVVPRTAPSVPTPAAPAAPVPAQFSGDRLGDFTAAALVTITLAVTDPSKAAAEFARLNAQYAELERELGKARSYLSTLDNLIAVKI